MMTNVRASNLHPTLQEDILLASSSSSSSSQTLPFCLFPPIHHPFSTLLKFLPSFPSVEAASRASRASLPSCLQREHPSTRRFGKLPLFLSRSNISAASKRRRARHHAFPVKRLPLDFLSTRRTRDRERSLSPSEILEVWIFVWIFFLKREKGASRKDWTRERWKSEREGRKILLGVVTD